MFSRTAPALFVLGLLAAPASAQGVQRYLPADARAVYVFNVAPLDDEQKKIGNELVKQLYATQVVPELKKLDKIPLTDLKQVMVVQSFAGGVNLFGGGAAAVVLVRGKVDAALLDKQVREAAKLNKAAVKIETLGKPAATIYARLVAEKKLLATVPAFEQIPAVYRAFLIPKAMHVVALDNETLMISFMGRPAIERALRARPEKTKPRVSDEMKKLLDGLDDKDAVSVALVEGTDGLYSGLALVAPKEVLEWFAPQKSTLATVRLGKAIKLTLTATCKSEDDAKKLEKSTAAAAKAALEALPDALTAEQKKVAKALLESLKVSRKDAVVTAAGELSEDDLKKLVPQEKKDK